MNEKEYITLNDLLTKYRVEVLRKLGRTQDTTSTESRALVRQLRCIDYLRNNMILNFDEKCIREGEPDDL